MNRDYYFQRVNDSKRIDILNIGGFSDAVFQVVASFLADDTDRFVAAIEAIEL